MYEHLDTLYLNVFQYETHIEILRPSMCLSLCVGWGATSVDRQLSIFYIILPYFAFCLVFFLLFASPNLFLSFLLNFLFHFSYHFFSCRWSLPRPWVLKVNTFVCLSAVHVVPACRPYPRSKFGSWKGPAASVRQLARHRQGNIPLHALGDAP